MSFEDQDQAFSPARYIEKVSLVSGEVLDEEIRPEQLLVHHHRDYHVMDVQARRVMSRLVESTGDEELVRRKMREVRRIGHKASSVVAKAIGQRDSGNVSKALFGLKEKEYYFRYRRHPHPRDEIESVISALRSEARAQYARAIEQGGLRVLLTGGTGFVGKEIMWQSAHDSTVREVVVLIRPKTIRDRKTGEVVRVLSPAERGEILLEELWLSSTPAASKFRFISGDCEQPNLGISASEHRGLANTLTHVIHCAASVAFDDPFDQSFRANVLGTLNALRMSLSLQESEGSPFVAHLGIETTYIHGRQVQQVAREDEIVFPRNFYNNYYELTKAMGSIETERFMLDRGLRVVQLCPAIVIGESRAGNNRGDTKVVNAPVNVFGRAHEALSRPQGRWRDRSKGMMLAKMACIFPGDPSAQINLIPVDRVVNGIIAALGKPDAIGERVHLGTDNRLTSAQIADIVEQELGIRIKLADPTLHRNVTLPVLSKLLTSFRQPRIARALEKLGTIFGSYSEWGQPIHEVGNDVRVLGLSEQRPNTEHAFRMLCRHNRFVQDFGRVRDALEISRRERLWLDFIHDLEDGTGTLAGDIPAAQFHESLEARIDLQTFETLD